MSSDASLQSLPLLPPVVHEPDFNFKKLYIIKGITYPFGFIIATGVAAQTLAASSAVLLIYEINVPFSMVTSVAAFTAKEALMMFFLFNSLKKFAEYMADRNKPSLTSCEIMKLALFFLLGAPSAAFFGMTAPALLNLFAQIIIKYTDRLPAFFQELGQFATTTGTEWTLASCSFAGNFIGNPSLFAALAVMPSVIRKKWRELPRKEFTALMVGVCLVYGAAVPGTYTFFPLARELWQTYAHVPDEVAILASIYQFAFMALGVSFALTFPLGMKAAQFLWDSFHGRVSCPTVGQAMLYGVGGVIFLYVLASATLHNVSKAVLTNQPVGWQVTAAITSFLFDVVPLATAAVVVKDAVGSVAETVSKKSWWGTVTSFFCCGRCPKRETKLRQNDDMINVEPSSAEGLLTQIKLG